MTMKLFYHSTKPNERAQAICARYLQPNSRAMCSGCPLRTPCTAPLPDWSQAGIDAHMEAVNAAADAAIEWALK